MQNFQSIYNGIILDNSLQDYLPAQTEKECYNLYSLINQTNCIEGDLAEVGVYEGGSSFIINKCKHKDKKLYLFDTFSGFQDVGKFDNENILWNGKLSSDCYIRLKKYFINDNVEIVKGYFPDSAPALLQNKKFSFVHLDADTYLSTLKCLEFFYDKISIGGVILIHDYTNDHAPGVKKAVDQFLITKKEVVNILDDSQSIIIKS